MANSRYTSKLREYQQLVEARKRCDTCASGTNPLVNASHIQAGRYDVDEIGGWSLWQGNLDARLLIVGKDFSTVSQLPDTEGEPDPHLRTNARLRSLLVSAGIQVNKFGEEAQTTHEDHFFTNSVLCMKAGGMSADLPVRAVRVCGERFLRQTIDLVEPHLVVALGREAMIGLSAAHRFSLQEFSIAVDQRTTYGLPWGGSIVAAYHPSRSRRGSAFDLAQWRWIASLLPESPKMNL